MVEVLKKVESDVDIDVDDSEERAEYQALYRRALLELRGEFEQRTWQAFLATALEGKNATEVAKDLGLTPAAVRKAKSRVLGRLRAELGELSTGQQS
jgi:RNA polymerase sigma-70 factor (ECF subfamily)